MEQVDLASSIGYSLKRVAWALRAAMDAELRAQRLTVPQYACLELLAQRPGLSNADLARGVFVSRQATHQLLAVLRQTGLVEVDGTGRDQRISLTDTGRQRLTVASAAVAQVEQRMLSDLDADDQDALRGHLDACADALTGAGYPDPAADPS